MPALIEHGWSVIATARKPDPERFAECRALPGAELIELPLDVTNPAQIADAVQVVTERCGGRLDLLVNNAGVGVYGALEDLSLAQFKQSLDVNVLGVVAMTQAMLPALRSARGHVMQVSSVLGYCGIPLSSAYCASKYAVEGATEALRLELLPFGVRFTLVEPGSFVTGFHDNVVWGVRSDEQDSVYSAQTLKYQEFRRTPSPRRSRPASRVVRRMAQIAERGRRGRRVPLRVRVGNEAHAIYWLKRIFPGALFDWVFRRGLREMFGDLDRR